MFLMNRCIQNSQRKLHRMDVEFGQLSPTNLGNTYFEKVSETPSGFTYASARGLA